MSQDSPPAFTLMDVPATLPWTLDPGGSLSFTISFESQQPGHFEGSLEIWLQEVSEPIIAPVMADVVNPPCTGDLCTALVAICPEEARTLGGAGVDLGGKVFEFHAGSNVSCNWSLLSAPAGSIAAPTHAGDCEATLKPDVRGDYQVQLAVQDDGGRRSSCR